MAIERITRISGRGLPLRGNDIDTDRIIPARFLKSVSFEGLETHLFEDDIAQAREQNAGHALIEPAYAGASILVVNRNFGCGSSREHAPQAIQRKGFRGVVGESFSEIFFGNSVALGMPCVTGAPADVTRLQTMIEQAPDAEIAIDIEAGQLRCGAWRMAISLPAAARESFVDGSWDATGLLLDRFEEVEATKQRLPYVNGWR
ncbi:MAG TPA: 3-isopropylmalate dehydratase small subunit [Vicinamibacterales bacterium]|nr:3-isopropylmalate dehydratase small subunit [Vicinamibacterales bacterium]